MDADQIAQVEVLHHPGQELWVGLCQLRGTASVPLRHRGIMLGKLVGTIDLTSAVFGTSSDFLQPLDLDHYRECLELFAELPDAASMMTNEEGFCSLFALEVDAHMQRHRNTGNANGGLAGLMELCYSICFNHIEISGGSGL
ncbi:hypothetical protein PG984_000552 [Apiospora sp. TS-2023a]